MDYRPSRGGGGGGQGRSLDFSLGWAQIPFSEFG